MDNINIVTFLACLFCLLQFTLAEKRILMNDPQYQHIALSEMMVKVATIEQNITQQAGHINLLETSNQELKTKVQELQTKVQTQETTIQGLNQSLQQVVGTQATNHGQNSSKEIII